MVMYLPLSVPSLGLPCSKQSELSMLIGTGIYIPHRIHRTAYLVSVSLFKKLREKKKKRKSSFVFAPSLCIFIYFC